MEAILRISLSIKGDELIWTLENPDVFSVKAMYRELVKIQEQSQSPLRTNTENFLWRLQFHERLKLLSWKLVWEMLPSKGRIVERIVYRTEDDVQFLFCGGCC